MSLRCVLAVGLLGIVSSAGCSKKPPPAGDERAVLREAPSTEGELETSNQEAAVVKLVSLIDATCACQDMACVVTRAQANLAWSDKHIQTVFSPEQQKRVDMAIGKGAACLERLAVSAPRSGPTGAAASEREAPVPAAAPTGESSLPGRAEEAGPSTPASGAR